MSAAEELTRKKNERKSHRASVTKMIHRVTENLESPSENLLKLRQQQQTLTEKAVILSTLDGDIVKLVPEEELDGEIETADDYREKITLAIVEIDEALPLPQSPPPQSPQVLPVSSSPYQSTPHPSSPLRSLTVI
jgi:predicted metal-dependent hydrolase